MDNQIHLIMPMAGRGSRFSKVGFPCPKPLIEIYGRPFFFWSVRSIEKFIPTATIDFVVLKEHVDRFSIDREIIHCFPQARIHVLPDVTEGAVVTSLEGIGHIKDDGPVLFNDCDHLFKSSPFNAFCSGTIDETIDGLLLSFEADEPKYSFVEKNDRGEVIRTVEKEVISSEAICGCYYFKNKDVFAHAAKQYLIECNYSEYYMSGVYNTMIKNGLLVKSMLTDYHVPFGVPEEYELAMKDKKYEELL